jgi:hypothetical protein
MSTETVSIGCRLPNGYRLEVGFSVNDPGKGGAPFALYRKHEDYQVFVLKGLNQRSLLRDAQGKPFATAPAQIGREPFINQGVPKDFWDRWVKENPRSWALKTGQIFLVPKTDTSTTKAVVLDAKAKSPEVFAPLDPGVTMKIEANEISKRIDE